MKIAAPKQLNELSKAIADRTAIVEQIDADIQRAEAASQEAATIAAELEALSRERAERKALAFVAKTTADVADLNAKEKKLELASRQAIEDGHAARIAIGLLQDRRSEVIAEANQLTEQRCQLAVEWLTSLREEAIDRYIEALESMGGPLADAVAADKLLAALGVFDGSGVMVREQVCAQGLIVPHSRKVKREGPSGLYDAPVDWVRNSQHGIAETQKLVAALQQSGFDVAIRQG